MKIEYLYIKGQDDFYESIDQFKSQLSANNRLEIAEDKILFSNTSFGYSLTKREIVWKRKKENVFFLAVNSEESNDSQALKMEELDSLLRRINEKNGSQFIIYTILDDVSSYYTNKLYPHMSEAENLLREIIYRLMINTAGSEWYNSTVPEEVKKSIGNVVTKNEKDIESVDQLYYADFIQLGKFLFNPYTIKPIGSHLTEQLQAIVNDKNGPSKEAITKLIEQYDAKSNWERYFAKKIDISGLEKKWYQLYNYRNTVAHCKRINSQEYVEAKKLLGEVISAFKSCLEHIDDVQLTEEEAEAAHEIVQETVAARQIIEEPGTPFRWSIQTPKIMRDSLIEDELQAVSHAYAVASPIPDSLLQLEQSGHLMIDRIGLDRMASVRLSPKLTLLISENAALQSVKASVEEATRTSIKQVLDITPGGITGIKEAIGTIVPIDKSKEKGT